MSLKTVDFQIIWHDVIDQSIEFTETSIISGVFWTSDFCQASDMVSTSRILVAVVQMCYQAKDWDALNENIMLLTKRRSQLKQVDY